MPRHAATGLTPLELEIMKILWETGPLPVQAVQDRLAPSRKLAYNTVQTMLTVLHRKGKVRRTLKDRAHQYAPVVSRLQAARQAVGDIVQRMFEGSPEGLVMSLVETRQLTPQKLTALAALIEKDKARADET
jgi:BlaI family transcriptional regulator, penicillinase repressor